MSSSWRAKDLPSNEPTVKALMNELLVTKIQPSERVLPPTLGGKRKGAARRGQEERARHKERVSSAKSDLVLACRRPYRPGSHSNAPLPVRLLTEIRSINLVHRKKSNMRLSLGRRANVCRPDHRGHRCPGFPRIGISGRWHKIPSDCDSCIRKSLGRSSSGLNTKQTSEIFGFSRENRSCRPGFGTCIT